MRDIMSLMDAVIARSIWCVTQEWCALCRIMDKKRLESKTRKKRAFAPMQFEAVSALKFPSPSEETLAWVPGFEVALLC